MTTERIDYAREARGSLTHAYRHRAMGDEAASHGRLDAAEHYFAAARDGVGFAQVEATLALVEQQRLANTIAALPHLDDETYKGMTPVILEGLGL